MELEFTKMQGTGNDYIFVDAFAAPPARPDKLSIRMSDRHFGVGSDGLILVCPPREPQNDCRMEMYNSDGSRGKMCGNGIRCLALFVHSRGICRSENLRIETDTGVREVELKLDAQGSVGQVRVDMGRPGLRRSDLPMVDGCDPQGSAIDREVLVLGQKFRMTAVSMGNPHAVVHLAAGLRPADLDIESIGPLFEHHEWFPERVNTEFVSVLARDELEIRVWERGSGETLACGTGACAALVASVLQGVSARSARIHLRGGDLHIEWPDDAGSVWMTGPAEEVFRGRWRQ